MERLNYSTILNKLSKILYNHKLTKKLMDKLELENYNLTNHRFDVSRIFIF